MPIVGRYDWVYRAPAYEIIRLLHRMYEEAHYARLAYIENQVRIQCYGVTTIPVSTLKDILETPKSKFLKDEVLYNTLLNAAREQKLSISDFQL